ILAAASSRRMCRKSWMTSGTCGRRPRLPTLGLAGQAAGKEGRMPIIDLFRGVHIAAGSLALVAVWIPLFSPKGGRVHRQAGRVVVIATAVLTVAAISACGWRLLFDTDPGRRLFATYLLFV